MKPAGVQPPEVSDMDGKPEGVDTFLLDSLDVQ